MVEQQQTQREGHHIHHAPQGDGLADLEIAPDCQRNVDQQAQVAHTDAEKVLDHGADTVDAGGGKLIGKYEQFIVHGGYQRHHGNDQIGPNFFHCLHSFDKCGVWSEK